MSKKSLVALALIVAALVAAWYFFLRKPGAVQAAKINSAKLGLGPQDDAAFNRMLELLRTKTDGARIHELLSYVEMTLTGTNPNPLEGTDYLVTGRLSKTGALLAEYARAFFKDDGTNMGLKEGVTPMDLNNAMYGIFYDLRNKAIIAA